MTYCPPDHTTTQTYEFTAFTGADLLQAGDHELSCGDQFDVPASATTCITVTDNDGSLSGDARRNELGDDRSWQIADIEVDGALVHDDAKIYAEEYYVLHGSDGSCYYLIEIEVAGTHVSDQGDFYAFYGDVPAAGVTLTVAGKCNVKGNWLEYRDLSAGLKWDFDADGKLTIEAEDMALKGYKVDDMHAASGGEVIRLKKATGEASVAFGGEAGTYDLELAYVDENDGEGAIEVWVGDALVHTVDLTANNNGNGNDWSTISTVTIPGLSLAQGDEIVLRGIKDCWEMARIDALTFCVAKDTPVDPGGQPPEGELCIEFDTFADGSHAVAGDDGTLVFDGVTFQAIRAQDDDGVLNDAMLFDSDAAQASGGDSDLLVGQGNLIIISEDGHSHDPDDNWQGGMIVADFDTAATLSSVMIVDVEESGGFITLYGADDSVLAEVAVPVVGDGQIQWVDLGGTEDVTRMTIEMTGSGAVGAVKFVPGEPQQEPPNTAPAAVADAIRTDEDTPVTLALLANDSDPESDPITMTSAGGAAAGTAFTVQTLGGRSVTMTIGADGMLSLDPTADFNALAASATDSISFDYTITDGNGGTATATATITIDGLNDAPTADDDAYTVTETGLATLDILTNDNDPDGDPLTVTLLSAPVEGAITLNADGTVAFDPGTDFLALEDGQQATVSFDYQISDGEFTDTATVTVTVIGEGQNPDAPEICVADTGTLYNGDAMTVELCAPDHTDDGSADLTLTVDWGDKANEQYNVVYVMDISGSTVAETIDGKTILQAEKDALQSLTADLLASGVSQDDLTITVLPFNGRALPTEPVEGTPYFSQTFTGTDLTQGNIDSALDDLQGGGETNYISAIFAAGGVIQQNDPTLSENNIIYFLSDGDPFPQNTQPVAVLEAVSAQVKQFAQIHGVAIGEDVDPSFVDALDNTGGATLIRDLDDLGNDIESLSVLDAALREAPVDPGTILSATLTVLDNDGAVVDSFAFTGADFNETPLGFELNVTATGLDQVTGQTNTAQLVVDLDGDGDQIADDQVTLAIDIDGLSPLSIDLA